MLMIEVISTYGYILRRTQFLDLKVSRQYTHTYTHTHTHTHTHAHTHTHTHAHAHAHTLLPLINGLTNLVPIQSNRRRYVCVQNTYIRSGMDVIGLLKNTK